MYFRDFGKHLRVGQYRATVCYLSHYGPVGVYAEAVRRLKVKEKIIKILKIVGYVVTAAIGFLSGLQF